MFFLPSLLYFGRSAASGLPCAGAAPPQRPPTKPSLTDRVYSSPASCLANGVYSPTCRLNPPTTDLQPQKLLITDHCSWAVGRKRPPLCRGCAPATPPSKTRPHRSRTSLLLRTSLHPSPPAALRDLHGQKVLPLPFFATLRVPSRTKRCCP